MTGIAASPPRRATLSWTKSSYSGGEGNECVEVARTPSGVGIRDSKAPRRRGLTVGADAFSAFVDGLK